MMMKMMNLFNPILLHLFFFSSFWFHIHSNCIICYSVSFSPYYYYYNIVIILIIIWIIIIFFLFPFFFFWFPFDRLWRKFDKKAVLVFALDFENKKSNFLLGETCMIRWVLGPSSFFISDPMIYSRMESLRIIISERERER